MEAIKKKIDKTLESNAYLSEKFANLKKNFQRMSSYSKADDIEISKRQEHFSNKQARSPPTLHQATRRISPLLSPVDPFKYPRPSSIPPPDEIRYNDILSKLIEMNNQNPQGESNPLAGVINPETQLIVNSLVMQDLFTNAFKRFLQSSKPRILQNINQSLGLSMPTPPPMPLDVLRRHSETKRKNTDTASDTIESDMHHPFASHGGRATPNLQRQQLNLSAFFPNSKERSHSMNTSLLKQPDLKWGPKEEKKQ